MPGAHYCNTKRKVPFQILICPRPWQESVFSTRSPIEPSCTSPIEPLGNLSLVHCDTPMEMYRHVTQYNTNSFHARSEGREQTRVKTRRHLKAATEASVVDPHVDASQLGLGVGSKAGNTCRVTHVAVYAIHIDIRADLQPSDACQTFQGNTTGTHPPPAFGHVSRSERLCFTVIAAVCATAHTCVTGYHSCCTHTTDAVKHISNAKEVAV